jgi:hypothetical protein
MAEELQTNPEAEKNAGCFGIGCSVLFPIVGIILYFAQKKSVNNPSAYLYGALVGFIIGAILRMVAAAGA